MPIVRFYTLLTFLLLSMSISYSQNSSTGVNLDSRMDSMSVSITTPNVKPEQLRHLYIKTNGIGWMMGITNIAAEIDLAKHWTVTLPLYWSSWNYFKTTLKFRTFTLQPEIRYWIMAEDNEGVFAGAHLGLGWYNFALDGDYRTQDHGGHCPSFGGGISAGYRMPFSHNKRLRLEFSLGMGVYGAHYDKFHNYRNGLLAETCRKTWFGIDQAAVSFVYTFDLGKKGGAQ